MPDTENTIRIKNPESDNSIFRLLSNGKVNFVGTIRLGNGISALLGLKKGGGTAIYDYLFDKSKWDTQKVADWINSHKGSIRSTIGDKPKIENGIWIPFMRDGMLTQDSTGTIRKIPKEAIDRNYKSYIGGYFDVNHDDKITGKIVDLKRDGEFAFAKIDGIDEETLSVVNSPAYRGVSQEAILKGLNGDGSVQDFEGKGLAFVLYPKKAGCPLSSGCGLPMASIIDESDQSNFSLYSIIPEINLNSQILEGDTKKLAESDKNYSAADMKSMLQYMKSHPDMIDDSMRGMMKSMMGGMMKSTISNRGYMAEPETTSAETLTKPNPEMETLRSNIEALKSEIAVLKSTVAQKDEQINKFSETLTSTIKNALDAHDKQLKAETEYNQTVDELKSTITVKESVDQILAAKPDIVVLKSTIAAFKAMHPADKAGAGQGTPMTSTITTDFATLDQEFNAGIGLSNAKRG